MINKTPEGLIYFSNKESQDEEEKIEERLELAYNFADVAIKWGARFQRDENIAVLQTKDWGVEPSITIEADIRQNKQTVVVMKGDRKGGYISFEGGNFRIPLKGRQIFEELPCGLLKAINKEEGFLIWDKNLDLSEAMFAFDNIHEEAKKRDLYDPQTKTRKPLPETPYLMEMKFKVEDIFSEKGNLFFIGIEDPEKLLQKFDHPEELVLRYEPYGGLPMGFVHKRDVDYIDLKEKVANEVLIERNINPLDLVRNSILNPESGASLIEEIKTEIDKRMAALEKAEKPKS